MSDRPHNPGRQSPSERGDGELLEACLIPLDPALDGFHGVVVELNARRTGSRYEIVQSAAMSGNVITRISCEEEATARRVYAELCKSGVLPAP